MALARRSSIPHHDRGQVLTDVAVMLADGGEANADIDVLAPRRPILGRSADGDQTIYLRQTRLPSTSWTVRAVFSLPLR